VSPSFPSENQTASDYQRDRKISYANECESEVRDLITYEINKNVMRIFSVQFHNIEVEETFGKIVNFKIDQNLVPLSGLSD
jgi:hypothetical protein